MREEYGVGEVSKRSAGEEEEMMVGGGCESTERGSGALMILPPAVGHCKWGTVAGKWMAVEIVVGKDGWVLLV